MFVAICESAECGAVFEAAIIGGSGSAKVSIEDSRVGPCPSCGGMGRIPDGVYQYSAGVVNFLSGSDQSLEALRRVEGLLRQMRKRGAAREEVLAEVRGVSPVIADALGGVPDVGVKQQWIMILLAIMTLAIDVASKGLDMLSVSMGDRFVEHLLRENEKLMSDRNREVLNPYARSGKKTGRNERCPCGSGLKFKRCCGR